MSAELARKATPLRSASGESLQSDVSSARLAWAKRASAALVLITFPVIWVGGLVTTYDAGMAVPDWPGTYGYNLFLYPLSTWFFGPFNLFVEHGHRLLASLSGLAAILTCWTIFRATTDRWLRTISIVVVGMVVFQGILGGARVLLDSRQVALIHGIVGPTYFSLAWLQMSALRRPWFTSNDHLAPSDQKSAGTAMALAFIVFGQVGLGAFLRHPLDAGEPRFYWGIALCHGILAFLIWGAAIVLARSVKSESPDWLRRGARAIVILVMAQVGLGLCTWLFKYGAPGWLLESSLVRQIYPDAPQWTNEARSMAGSMIVTLHVATGALLLANCLTPGARSCGRLFSIPFAKDESQPALMKQEPVRRASGMNMVSQIAQPLSHDLATEAAA